MTGHARVVVGAATLVVVLAFGGPVAASGSRSGTDIIPGTAVTQSITVYYNTQTCHSATHYQIYKDSETWTRNNTTTWFMKKAQLSVGDSGDPCSGSSGDSYNLTWQPIFNNKLSVSYSHSHTGWAYVHAESGVLQSIGGNVTGTVMDRNGVTRGVQCTDAIIQGISEC